MYEYIIYDFDGTIANSYPVFAKALVETMKRHGKELTYQTAYDQLKVSVGHAIRLNASIEGVKELTAEFYEIYFEIARKELEAFSDAKDILQYVIDHKKKNYIYTHTGKFVYEMLEKMGISDMFEFVLDGSYGFPSKPKPDALLFLMKKCNIDPQKALMVGDRDIDTNAAHNAGIAGCLIEDGYYPDCKTEYYIKHLSELKNII